MMVFFRERLAYLAVPKTGSTALEAALHKHASMVLRNPPGLKHTNATGFDRKFRGLFERNGLPPIETVAVIRDPLDWLDSWYRYRQRPALNGHRNSTANVSFDDFAAAYMSTDPPDFARLGSQAKFLCDPQGNLLVDHLFAYEDLPRLNGFLEDRLGFPIKTQPMNVSPKGRGAVSKETRTALEEFFALDQKLRSRALRR